MNGYLSLGTNLGQRLKNLKQALERLKGAGVFPKRCSSVYLTQPIGLADQPNFLNLAVEIATALPPFPLLQACRSIESAMGRVRNVRFGPRVIDIDILLLGDLRLLSEALTVPHPRMHERRFVLQPLCEIAPQVVHPVQNQRLDRLLDTLSDTSRVKRYCGPLV